MIHSLGALISLAREHSPFYRELYSSVPENESRLSALPIVSQRDFWAANASENNRLLTGTMSDGVVYKSGGTTGQPKFSVYRREEWETFCSAFGRGMAANGLRTGERVGNLFYAGELYASFLFILKSLELSPTPVLNFPIGGAASLDAVARTAMDFGIETLAGVPTTLMAFAEHVAAHRSEYPGLKISKVLFGGESLYPDQRTRLGEIFPGIVARSTGYASVDAGLLGYADLSCGPGEHRVFGAETLLELIDEESGLPITEAHHPGILVVTNLTRTLMPIIRYPVGDKAEWLETADVRDRKFRLRGRSEEGARVGAITLYYEDVRPIVGIFQKRFGIVNYQLQITHQDRKDGLTLRVAVGDPAALPETAERELLDELIARRPMLRDWAAAGKVHPTRVEWISPARLTVNSRTGKLRRVIDER